MYASFAILALAGIASAADPTTTFATVTATSTVTCASATSTQLNFAYCRCSNSMCYDITKEGNCDWDLIESAPEPPLFCPSP